MKDDLGAKSNQLWTENDLENNCKK
jgi:hypothetical protein